MIISVSLALSLKGRISMRADSVFSTHGSKDLLSKVAIVGSGIGESPRRGSSDAGLGVWPPWAWPILPASWSGRGHRRGWSNKRAGTI